MNLKKLFTKLWPKAPDYLPEITKIWELCERKIHRDDIEARLLNLQESHDVHLFSTYTPEELLQMIDPDIHENLRARGIIAPPDIPGPK